MDATRIHVFLNYIPLTGSVLGLAMIVFGMWRQNDRVSRTSLGLFVLTAIFTLAVYATGEIAGKGADQMVGPVWENIRVHRASAMPTFAAIMLTGIFALIGLISMLRRASLARWNKAVIMILAVASLLLALRTTDLGRHIFTVGTAVVSLAPASGRSDLDNDSYRKNNNTEIKLWLA